MDADGSLWVGTRRGLTHWQGAPAKQHMETYTQATGLGNDLVGAMARDSQGNLWVATLAGLSCLQSAKITNYTTANGLSSNVVTSLLPRADGTLLVGTQDRGLSLWNGGKFFSANATGHDATSIHAILADARTLPGSFEPPAGSLDCRRRSSSERPSESASQATHGGALQLARNRPDPL